LATTKQKRSVRWRDSFRGAVHGGDGADERVRAIDLKATAIAASVVILAVVIAFVVQVAPGHNGNPYTWLPALGGISYLVAYLRGSRR
jgi:hypothetical protein